jgi:hypothetical protein
MQEGRAKMLAGPVAGLCRSLQAFWPASDIEALMPWKFQK